MIWRYNLKEFNNKLAVKYDNKDLEEYKEYFDFNYHFSWLSLAYKKNPTTLFVTVSNPSKYHPY